MNSPHRRFNPLTNDWVLVSPQRTQRPWLGQVEKTLQEKMPQYDPQCYLCPGNARAGGEKNPQYETTFVFDNDFAALLPPRTERSPQRSISAPETARNETARNETARNETARNETARNETARNETAFVPYTSPLLRAEPTPGKCRVVCFHPRHDLTLPLMTLSEIETVIHTWTHETQSLGALEYVNYVEVFENKGAAMGASNPHPHSQIWASHHIPNEPAKEFFAQEKYSLECDGCLLCDYLRVEQERGERIVVANEHFTVVVPYWAIWPFEVLLLANRHMGALADLNAPEITALADILKKLTTRYDNLFRVSFPYSMGFHQTPTDGQAYPSHHFHAHYYPPLLRSATVRKFMVGYELLAMPQRDLTPESAAERMRGLSGVHYLESRLEN